MARPFITNYNWTTVDEMDMLDIGGGNGGGNMWTKGGGQEKIKLKLPASQHTSIKFVRFCNDFPNNNISIVWEIQDFKNSAGTMHNSQNTVLQQFLTEFK